MIKESYEGEYENRQHAAEAGMESWKEGRRKVLLHLRQCQAELASLQEENKRLKNLIRDTYISAYEKGHNDTVESFYCPEDSVDDYMEALNAEQGGE